MGRWIGWRVFPPKSWWTGRKADGTYKPVLVRDPIAHTLGAIVMWVALTAAMWGWPFVTWWQIPLLVVFFAVLRQEFLVEKYDGGYKAWRATWCTLVNAIVACILQAGYLLIF
jgi:hypothetical protein